MKYSVVLPAKNEVGAIGETIKKIQQLNMIDEIIVVNDGSTDTTQLVAESAGAKVITHPYSKGNGAAIKTGARNASGEIIVFMDADGQHNPNDIPKLLEKINEGYDLVVGARQKGSQASVGRGIAKYGQKNLKNSFIYYQMVFHIQQPVLWPFSELVIQLHMFQFMLLRG